MDAFFFILSLSGFGVVLMMAYGMVQDNAAFMLPFPIILAIPALALNFYTGYELFTGKRYPIPFLTED